MNTPPPSHSAIRQWADQYAKAWQKLEAVRLSLYVRLLPWFGPAMQRAGWPDDTADARAILERGHAEWTALTGLPPLCDEPALRAAAAAVGYPDSASDDLTFDRLSTAIYAWAVAKRAATGKPVEVPPGEVPKADDGTVWMTATQAARYVDVSAKTITRWIKDGILQQLDCRGTKYQFSRLELDSYRDARAKK